MQNIWNKIKENWKIIVCVIAGIIVAGVILFFALGSFKSTKNEFENNLMELGKDFYENFYFDQVGSNDEERKKFLSRFVESGIKINLDNLARISSNEEETLNKFKSEKDKKECNKDNTKIIIYPEEPFGKTNYRIDAELDCGFEEK